MTGTNESSDKAEGKTGGTPGKENEYYAFDKYPNRREPADRKNFWYFASGECRDHATCERNVCNALKKNPVVKLLINALRSAGCSFDAKRNITCEICDSTVTGGYDTEMNQIVICQNSLKARTNAETTLIHELIHMFDYCVNDIDFKNVEHLACTEIRAANMSHCSFMSSFLLAQSSPFSVKATHQYCVKMKATQSLMLARNMDFKTAYEHVVKVFDKCYNDLEPIGRRIRRNSCEGKLAYNESVHYGYSKHRYEE